MIAEIVGIITFVLMTEYVYWGQTSKEELVSTGYVKQKIAAIILGVAAAACVGLFVWMIEDIITRLNINLDVIILFIQNNLYTIGLGVIGIIILAAFIGVNVYLRKRYDSKNSD
jgi:hypothetical protein